MTENLTYKIYFKINDFVNLNGAYAFPERYRTFLYLFVSAVNLISFPILIKRMGR